MSYHYDDGIDEVMRRSAERRFEAWLCQLRERDERFGAASLLHEDKAQWQAAIYLLTGCNVVWAELGARILADGSLDCVIRALDERDRWSCTEIGVMGWAAHCWDEERHGASGAPWTFEEFSFRRWVTAAHLRRRMAPALTIIDERRG